RLALELRWTRERMVDRRGVSARECLADEDVDRVPVLGVHHHERSTRRGDLHRTEERLVVDLEDVLVGHEELVRRDSLLGQRRQLLEPLSVGDVGDGDVEPVVDDRLAVRLRMPGPERLCECLALALDAEVDVTGGAAARRRALSRLEVVDRDRAAERHVEMRVRVDTARQDELAGRVDHLVRLDVQRLADQGDPLAVDEDVSDVVVGRGDDAAAFDQNGHCGSPFSARSYLPPGVTLIDALCQLLPNTSTPSFFSEATAALAMSVRYAPAVGAFLITLNCCAIFAVVSYA